MNITYTKHVSDKLRTKEAHKFKITKKRIEKAVTEPTSVEELPEGIFRSVGKLTEKYSFCVVYKYEGSVVKVITFFPAERGRYETKVLS